MKYFAISLLALFLIECGSSSSSEKADTYYEEEAEEERELVRTIPKPEGVIFGDYWIGKGGSDDHKIVTIRENPAGDGYAITIFSAELGGGMGGAQVNKISDTRFEMEVPGKDMAMVNVAFILYDNDKLKMEVVDGNIDQLPESQHSMITDGNQWIAPEDQYRY